MSCIVYKASFEDDFRRFSLDQPSFNFLQSKLCSCFNLSENQIRVCWKDEDGDLITMTCDAELRECIELPSKKPIRLFISKNSENIDKSVVASVPPFCGNAGSPACEEDLSPQNFMRQFMGRR
eukprot:57260_1